MELTRVRDSGPDEARAKDVLLQLEGIQTNAKQSFFTMCTLLLEAYENNFHTIWGYTKFGEWIESCNIDLSGRTAYYYIKIAERSRELGSSPEELSKLGISKLKEIFALDPAEYGPDMKQLIASGEDMTTEEIHDKVKSLKLKSGEEVYSHLNLKIPVLTKELVLEAFELARKLAGSTVNEYGDVADISDGKCLEYICASFMQDQNNYEQPVTIEAQAV